MKIRGKKLSASQRKVLEQKGIESLDDYLYVKTEVISIGGDKHLNQSDPKIEKLVIINRITGQIVRV